MAELSRDRVRAAKLRKQRKAGKLSTTNARWLAAYEQRTKAGHDRRPTNVTDAPVRVVETKAGASASAAQFAAFTLAEPPAPPAPVPVHTTEHITDVLSPDEFQWRPVVPAAPEGVEVEPPVPGVEAPTVGAPLLDDTPAAPVGDPVAAAQYASLVVLVTTIGINSALELSESWPMPPQMRTIVESEQLHKGMLAGVSAATQRLVMKWGWKSAPMSDEAVVAGALVGSAAAFVANEKRKRKGKAKRAPAPEVVERAPTGAYGDGFAVPPVNLAGPELAPRETVSAPTAVPVDNSMPPNLSALFGEEHS